MIQVTEEKDGWPKYAAWTVAIAFLSAVAAKIGEGLVEEARQKLKDHHGPRD
jgi:hypothetical protein